MKKLAIIGLFVALLITALLLWMHLQRSKLTGTWVRDLPNGARSVWTVNPDGSYLIELTGMHDGRVRTWVGTMEVSNGFLIDTATKAMVGTQMVAGVEKSHVNREKIILLDDHTLVLPPPPGRTNQVVFIKQ